MPKICDYEGSNYRVEFWEGRGRDYEDRVERVALRRLLPASGHRLLEVGAAFGRLTEEYDAFDQVVMLDYSFSQLQFARERFGDDGRITYVAADAYHLPFKAGTFDAATMVRVIHHMADVPAVLGEVRRVMAPKSTFILEHANKQNLKAILRYWLGKQKWSPFDHEPVEFVELNFDFHPAYIVQCLEDAGFVSGQRLPVSFFRLGALKRVIPTGFLVGLDALLQYTGSLYTPSIFVQSTATDATENHVTEPIESLLACPQCGGELIREGSILRCANDGLRYQIRDGIYDFKAPLD